MLVAPLFFFAHQDHLYYLGYIGINVLHNPTMLLIKPLALLWFVWGVYAFENSTAKEDSALSTSGESISWATIFSVALLCILSTLAKPSYSICILPAIGCMTLWQILNRRLAQVRWKLLIFGMIIPATFILVWQFSWQYGHSAQGNSGAGGPRYHIVFRPLGAVHSWSEHVLWKAWLSIFFPVIVALLFPKSTWRSMRLKLAWLVFLIAVGQFYLLSEDGREVDGNFTWGAQIALFILFISCLEMILARFNCTTPAAASTQGDVWRLRLCLLVFICHVTAGIVYYIHILRGNRLIDFFS